MCMTMHSLQNYAPRSPLALKIFTCLCMVPTAQTRTHVLPFWASCPIFFIGMEIKFFASSCGRLDVSAIIMFKSTLRLKTCIISCCQAGTLLPDIIFQCLYTMIFWALNDGVYIYFKELEGGGNLLYMRMLISSFFAKNWCWYLVFTARASKYRNEQSIFRWLNVTQVSIWLSRIWQIIHKHVLHD